MRRPIDPTVAELVELLDEDLAEMFEERAAVREYDGGYTRAHAEALGLLDVLNRYPDALNHVTVFAFDIDGATHFFVATDTPLARARVASRGADTYRTASVARVVGEQFGGVAKLTSAS